MKHLHCFFLLLFVLLFPRFVFSQKDTEFWFVAPEISQATNNLDRPVVFRFSTYNAPAVVSVSQPANVTFPVQTITMAANSSAVLEFPPFFGNVENSPPNTVLNKGFLITSTTPITAYYEIIGEVPNNPELFSLKGKNALGTTFYVPFQNATSNSNAYSPLPYAAFDIVATEDNTNVTIVPTQPVVGGPANQPLSITLNRGQTFSAQAVSQTAAGHPSGSKIVSNKPIAVTMKDDLLEGGVLFGGFCRDVIGDQLVPIEKIGTKYVAQKGYLNGDERAFVVGTTANTQVNLDGVAQGVIGEGQTIELVITDGSHFIETTAPVYVLQMTGINCEVAGEILPALDCSGSSEVRFVRSTDQEFYMFLVTKSGNEGGFSLNGNTGLIPANAFQTVPGSNGEFVAALLPFSVFNVAAGQSSVVSNSIGLFQMGFLDGGQLTGCRLGFFSDFGNQTPVEEFITFCPGSSVTINGITYEQPTTVLDTIPGVVGCDTVITYHLQFSPLDLIFHIEDIICENGQINMAYSLCNLGSGALPDSVTVTFYDADPTTGGANNAGVLNFNTMGADSCVTGIYTDVASDLLLPIGGTLYAVVNFDGSLPIPFSFDDFPTTGIEECNYHNNLDSASVQLPASPTLDLGPDVILCKDSTVVFDAGGGFVSYLWQDGSDAQTFAATDPDVYWVEVTDSCGFTQRDSVLLSVSLLPDTQFPDFDLCPGESVSLSLPGFDTYAWSPAAGLSCTDCADVTISPVATTTYMLLATTVEGCVLEDTFKVSVLPMPALTETIEFCKGDTVFIGGMTYTLPGTVVDTIPASAGCDTIATYILQYISDPNASVSIDCVPDIDISIQAGTGPIEVDYDLPTTASDCPCPGVGLVLTEGLLSGDLFPVTTTKVCYQASDSCGNTATCCFNVTIHEESPCDVKQIGCMKYELLDITRNASDLNLNYRIRVTNNCANKMIYTVIQIPDGMVAEEPLNNAIYVSPAGRDYLVRNPNFSPFYSIRFKSQADSIANGQSDIFEYTLPPQINPAYIHIASRLYPQIFYEAHLNTFYCPVEIVNDKSGQRTTQLNFRQSEKFRIFPNPTSGSIFADLSSWQGEQVKIQILDSRGQSVHQLTLAADAGPLELQLPAGLSNGLYFLEILTQKGEEQALRFVLER